jgi:carboxymethylenebutenolidase
VPAEPVELGYFARPPGGSAPGVVLIHDVWGVSDHTRDLAQRLAAEGFGVLALDLYRRSPPAKIENPGAFIRRLSDPQAVADVQAGIDFLAASPVCQGRRVGVTGFCMGGMYALLAACSCRDLSAAVVFYGLLSHAHGILHDANGLDPTLKPREPLAALATLGCPLLGFYGDRDEFVPASDLAALRARLAGARFPAELVVEPGCGHAYLNDTREAAYRPEAAKRSWARMVTFFREQLR